MLFSRPVFQRRQSPTCSRKRFRRPVHSGCGRPLPGHKIRIVDEAGYELPDRHVGCLEFRGTSATAGYYRNPEATTKLFHNGWLNSGDHAYMANGEVFVTGRAKELIMRGDRNLYPYDLEEAVGNLKGMRRGCVAVFTVQDKAGGSERLVIMAETDERDEADRAKLRRDIDRVTVDVIGMPADDIVLVPSHAVMKTSSGKIRRIASREAYEHGNVEKCVAAPWLHHARFLAKTLLAHARVRAQQIGAWAYGCYVWSVFALVVLFCGGVVMLLRRPPQGRRIARLGTRALFRLARVRLSVKRLDSLPARPHVLLVNHTSFLDAIVLAALLPSRPGYAFTARQEFPIQRLLCPLLRGLGTLVMARSDIRHGTTNVDLMTAALRRGESLVVFPEGAFSREPGLKPFHSGAFVAGANANVPIVVAGLRGTRTALRPGTWLPRRVAITLEVGPVFIPYRNDRAALAQLSATARKAMVSLSGEFDPFA